MLSGNQKGGMLMNEKVIVEHGEDGYFVAHVPSLKGCWSQGRTKEEALQNIREAIELYIEPNPYRFTSYSD
jgi:predicted RNase H-like HicB family nuclease